MSTDVRAIVDLYEQRKRDQDPLINAMKELTLAYNGDLPVVLPQLDKNEKPYTANLVKNGLDQFAMRVASVLPNVKCPPDQPGKPRSEDYAHIRRNAILGLWNVNALDLKMRYRARHMVGWSTSPVVIRPDFGAGVPKWQVMKPLHTYPAARENPDDMTPGDCIFAYRRTWAWLKARYPEKVSRIAGSVTGPDDLFDVLEYMDSDETVLLVIGKQPPPSRDSWGQEPAPAPAPIVELERVVNRIGCPPCVVPGAITLDRPSGKFDGMIGIYMQAAKLMALETIAIQRSVFPERWAVSRPQETVNVLQPPNPEQGIPGLLKGGEMVINQLTPGFQVQPMLDRLKDEALAEGGLPSDVFGQSATNIRTGRRGENIMDASVSYPVQEYQNVFERSLEAENEIALSMIREYGMKPKRQVMVRWGGPKQPVVYDPAKHFDSVANEVDFGVLGGDLNEQTVMWGQLAGLEATSLQTLRENHPAIQDPDAEHHRVVFEQLEKSLLMEVAQPGSFPLPDKARLMELVAEDRIPVYKAIATVQQEAQTRQATSGPPGTPEGPAQPGSPEAQPGIAPPGMGAEAGSPAPGPLPNLAQFMAALHGAGGRAA